MLNLTNSVNKSKNEIKKKHNLKQQCHFILLLQVFKVFYCGSCFTGLITKALHITSAMQLSYEQVYYVRKIIHMDMIMWCKCQYG